MEEQTVSEQSDSPDVGWFEVSCSMKIKAADESDAINRAAGAIKTGYATVKGVFPVGTFDARPCSSPLRTERRL